MDLRSARQKRGWRLEHVATLIGAKSPATVSRHEGGSRSPDHDQTERYLAIYGGDVTEEDIRKNIRAYRNKQRSAGLTAAKEPAHV